MIKFIRVFFFLVTISIFFSCDDDRLYEKNNSFSDNYWVADSTQYFEVVIDDKSSTYNVFLNIRNSSNYPYHNLYVNFTLVDSLTNILEKELVNNTLFDAKTGKPLGQSGIGDLFDHQFILLKNYTFQHTGKHLFKVNQYMRTDTLRGILAVGIRVEKNTLSD